MNATFVRLLHEPSPTQVFLATGTTPLGDLHVASVPEGVCALVFDEHLGALLPRLRRMFGPFFTLADGDPHDAVVGVKAYFAGRHDALRGIPLALAPTAMQRHVWNATRAVEAGATTTYVELARRLGLPRAQRAVGVCLASNPVPLFVPCHRVIAASGGLGSHPGGSWRKRWLLEHEGALAARQPRRRSTRSSATVASGTREDRVDFVGWPRLAPR